LSTIDIGYRPKPIPLPPSVTCTARVKHLKFREQQSNVIYWLLLCRVSIIYPPLGNISKPEETSAIYNVEALSVDKDNAEFVLVA